MKKLKYKCLNPDCGHVFEGDFSTSKCPECGCQDIKPLKTKIPNWVWMVLGGIVCVILAILLMKKCAGSDVKISGKLDITEYALRISIDGVSDGDLKAKYKIVMSNDSTDQLVDYYFSGRDASVTISVNDPEGYQFIGGVTYYFKFLERKTGNTPKNFRWTGISTYTPPIPPEAPQITVFKIANCAVNNYTIKIWVKGGTPDIFYLDDIEQKDSIFLGVLPRKDKYIIKAYDSANDLWSEEKEVFCKPFDNKFGISEEEINEILRLVSKQKMGPGEALEKINQNNDVKFHEPLDGNIWLEAALEYSYTMEVRYCVNTFAIANSDCQDSIEHISLKRWK